MRGEDGRKRAATSLAPCAKWEDVVLFRKDVPCSPAPGDGTSMIRVHWHAARAVSEPPVHRVKRYLYMGLTGIRQVMCLDNQTNDNHTHITAGLSCVASDSHVLCVHRAHHGQSPTGSSRVH